MVIHPLVVRITHWLNALAVLVMIASGWRIYNASPLFEWRFPPDLTLGGWLAGALQWHFAAMWLLQLWRPLKFLLIPGPIKTRRVRARAIGLFKVGAERRTTGRTGVLIYLSMAEHRAEIVADEAIAGKVPPETWGEAMVDMLAEIRQGRIAEGMAEGVKDVGAVLAEHFPRNAHDTNELPDRLIEL